MLGKIVTTGIVSLFCVSVVPLAVSAAQLGEPSFGKTPQYHAQKGKVRQDLSGAASDGTTIITVDDGGKPSDHSYLRTMAQDLSGNTDNRALKPSLIHQDMEAATYMDGHFVITTSLSKSGAKKQNYRRTTRFTIDPKTHAMVGEESVDLRDPLLAAMKKEFDKDWYARIGQASPKKGGFNIEGLAASADGKSLVFGVRSPLVGEFFGNPEFDKDGRQTNSFSLRRGKAIMAFVKDAFSDKPVVSFETIDLKGHGVRGMEYVPAMKGYVIISGPAIKANDYSLWLYGDDKSLTQLKVNGFDKLCRPEAVITTTVAGKPHLLLMSEESGKVCNDAKFTYIEVEIK